MLTATAVYGRKCSAAHGLWRRAALSYIALKVQSLEMSLQLEAAWAAAEAQCWVLECQRGHARWHDYLSNPAMMSTWEPGAWTGHSALLFRVLEELSHSESQSLVT